MSSLRWALFRGTPGWEEKGQKRDTGTGSHSHSHPRNILFPTLLHVAWDACLSYIMRIHNGQPEVPRAVGGWNQAYHFFCIWYRVRKEGAEELMPEKRLQSLELWSRRDIKFQIPTPPPTWNKLTICLSLNFPICKTELRINNVFQGLCMTAVTFQLSFFQNV